MKITKKVTVVHSAGQRFWGIVSLMGLFVCGIMVGVGLQSEPEPTQVVADKLLLVPEQIDFNQVTVDTKHNRNINVLAPAPAKVVSVRLSADVHGMIMETDCLERAIDSENGCTVSVTYSPEIDVEQGKNILIFDWISADGVVHNTGVGVPYSAISGKDAFATTCELIEESLLARLPEANEFTDAEDRILRAKIYANLSERGCRKNSENYVAMAQQELEIARALEDDDFDDEEKIEVVETYKRLNMQAVADEIFETAKKLTEPAIDFVLEVEKVITEQQ